MGKRLNLKFIFLFAVFSFSLIFLNNLVSSQLLNASISSTTGEVNQYKIYNITINDSNVPSGINFTQVNISAASGIIISQVNTTAPAVLSSSSTSQLVVWNNTSVNGLVLNGTLQYFWINASMNQVGNFNLVITTLDTKGNTNITTLSLTANDTIAPQVSFISPTDGLSSNVTSNNYIQANVTSSDSGSGINTTTIYLYNSTGPVSSITNTSGYYFVNFTNLSNGTYYLNATSFDLNGNSNSTSTYTIQVNYSIQSSCTPSWTCVTWGTCTNDSQTCTTMNDSNSCGINFNDTYPTQDCNSTCDVYWSCTDWSPAVCTTSNETQTRTCTDLNGCVPDEVQNQSCVSGSSLTTTQQPGQTGGISSSSLIFFGVVGFIVVITVVVIIVLLKLKNKSYSTDFGNTDNQNTGFKAYPPPRGPPSAPSYPNYRNY